MLDVSFAGCLGALHLPTGPSRAHAVILCPAFGYEGVSTHRGLAALAEDLAAAGFPALRFDYPGLGDSADLDPQADAVPAWLASIASAAALLSTQFPGAAISLVGYRFGSLLAATIAEQVPGLCSLVFIAPVVSGRGYLRELAIAHGEPEDAGAALPAGGWQLAQATTDHIRALSLRRLAAGPPCDVLLLVPAASRGAAQLAAALREAGRGTIALHEAPELASLNQHPHLMAAPEPAFAGIIEWLRGRQVPAAAPPPPLAWPAAEITLPCSREVPVRIGRDQYLFGVASMPLAAATGLPCLLILNSGGVPRSGHGRLSAMLARALARIGIASLRIDVTGNGDTRPILRTRNTETYNAARTDDVLVALGWMTAAGWGPIITFGLCSGAYFALHGARADPRIAGAILVNIQSFLWPRNKIVDVVTNRDIRQVESYWGRLTDPLLWRGLLRNDAHPVKKLRTIARHYATAMAGALQARLPPSIAIAPRMLRIRKIFETLAARHTPLLFVYAHGDPGINELQAVFGRNGHRLRASAEICIAFIHADHTLTSTTAKTELILLVERFLLDFKR